MHPWKWTMKFFTHHDGRNHVEAGSHTLSAGQLAALEAAVALGVPRRAARQALLRAAQRGGPVEVHFDQANRARFWTAHPDPGLRD